MSSTARRQRLEKDRKKKKLSRKKLKELASSKDKSALAKIKKIRDSKREQYIQNKALGKCKEWDAKRRRKKLLNYIQLNIESENKSINEPWVMLHNQPMTPLIAVIKQRDVKGVCVLLSMNASPCIKWKDKTDLVSPLEEAIWLGEQKISQLLLENGAAKGKLWCYGALHGAIAKKMIALVRLLIKKGALIDLVYAGMTPLCTALTCGMKGTGDVRMVRLIINAKADLYKKTSGPRYSNQTRKFTHLEVAEKYSNKNCLKLVSASYIRQ